jgi:DNA repair protein RadC
MNENTPTLPGLDNIVKPFRFEPQPHEYKVMPLRECPTPENLQMCDTPDKAAEYWQRHVATHPHFNPECECFVVLMLNTRRRVKGHYLVSIGTMDTILVHPREVFRLAIMTSAAAIVLMHNLCVAAHRLCYVKRRFMWSRWCLPLKTGRFFRPLKIGSFTYLQL